MPTLTTAELAQAWFDTLSDSRAHAALCSEDCTIWHSFDDKTIGLQAAVAAVADHGGHPPKSNERFTLMDGGFVVQYSAPLRGKTVHICAVIRAENGKVTSIEEYIGPEYDL
ncbi:hypothetical protein [Tsukamurella sp. NPDC003166]|uniref:hypothetical protein n=1 Tax=Tsukamurella sp. NPDC003166 TaxID=3154444 RepID=UPI0033A441E4